MDTKLKNVDKVSKAKGLKNFLLNRKLRTVVFSVTCILTVIIFMLTVKYTDCQSKYPYHSNGLYLQNYTESYEYSHKKLSFYEALCITSSFYLRNTDENNNFTLSKSALNDFVETMEDYDFDLKIDENGKCYADSELWDFFVAFDNKYITNIKNLNITDKTDIQNLPYDLDDNYEDYSLRVKNTVNSVSSANSYYYDELQYTNFFVENGLTSEYSDGEKLPIGASGYDNLGRFVFQYYGYDDVKFYDENQKDKKFDGVSFYDLFVMYNSDDEYISNELPGYESKIYDDRPITLFFAPKSEQLQKYSAALTDIQDDYKTVVLELIVCWITLSVLCLYLAVVCGYDGSKKKKWGYSVIFGRWYSEIQIAALIFMIVFFAISIESQDGILKFIKFFITGYPKALYAILCIFFAVCYAVCAGLALGILSKFKSKSFIKDSICLRLLIKLKNFIKKHIVNTKLFVLYSKKTIAQKLYTFTWIFIAFTIAIIILLFILPELFLILFFIYFIYAIWYIITLFKGFSDINTLCNQIKQLSEDEDITDEISEYSIIYEDSKRLRSISENVKENVEKQVQSERMKIELVTNVSHDLKTPLTSIISYIDLLKKEELSPEAADYVNILDVKSQKLKNIVADVFSLAKATSGIDVELEEIDGVILLKQVLGDNEDKITNSGKIFKTDILCDSAIIDADGNKLYRVFQNLIDNALNYSMNGTRIFVTLEKDHFNDMVLTVKNTASYEMNFTPEEITERFTRGDKSRTDGGSGLGLSIAKSFTESCGGVFKVELDGDVFKAIVRIPLKISDVQNI